MQEQSKVIENRINGPGQPGCSGRFFGKLKRTVLCQNRRLFSKVLAQIQPDTYHKHPKMVTAAWYLSRIGTFPHLKHPRDFNEQLLAINLHAYGDENERAIRIRCADKYEVRSYVEERGFGSYLNECYGVFDSAEDIDFDRLPSQFVIKLTNGCGQNYICKDKTHLDCSELRKTVDGWIEGSSRFGFQSAEWHYAAIKPRIVVEKYLSSLGEDISLIDYKFHCFHGKIAGILVCYDRNPETHRANLDYYSPDWVLTDGIYPHAHKHRRPIDKPESFDTMCRMAEELSRGIDYVRVDLFEVDDRPVFSEMTFTPAGNIMTNYKPWLLKSMLDKYKEGKC